MTPRPSVHSKIGTKTKALPGIFAYLEVYRASPPERIEMIKKGVPAADVKLFFTRLGISQYFGVRALNLSQATVNKKAKKGLPLSPDESERVIGVAKLVGQLQAMIEASGNPEGFEAAAWMSQWLSEPLDALGGKRPADLMDTMEGQALVSTLLSQMQSGAYA